MSLKKDLRHALARKSPPSDFAQSVLDRIDTAAPKQRNRRRLTRMLSRVAATLLVATIGTGAWLQHQDSVRQKREAEEASILVKLALQIASEKTNIARAHLSGGKDDSTKNLKEGTTHETTSN